MKVIDPTAEGCHRFLNRISPSGFESGLAVFSPRHPFGGDLRILFERAVEIQATSTASEWKTAF
jgi:hypothetical protein